MALSLLTLGGIACAEGDFVTARGHLEEGLAIAREPGNQGPVDGLLMGLGNVALKSAPGPHRCL
jgi:hypothetical protein